MGRTGRAELKWAERSWNRPVNALVTDHSPLHQRSVIFFSLETINSNPFHLFSLLQKVFSGIQYNDMLRPLELLSAEVIKQRTKSELVARHNGIYCELLFLSFFPAICQLFTINGMLKNSQCSMIHVNFLNKII